MLETTIGGVDFGEYTLLDYSVGWSHVTPGYSLVKLGGAYSFTVGGENYSSIGYGEAIYVGMSKPSCCGSDFTFEFVTYFQAYYDSGSGYALVPLDTLFNWSGTVLQFSVGLTNNLELTNGLTLTPMGLDSWSIGFDVTW